MAFLRRIFSATLHAALISGGLAYAAVPGPHRAMTPDLFGIPQVAPRLYLDEPAARRRVERLIAAAERRTAAFFGPLRSDPVWVVCTQAACRETLALSANGLTYGAAVLVIGPNGVNERTMTHERVHAELHRYHGITDIGAPRFPTWFDEGLATYLSGDARVARYRDPRDADWIRAGTNWIAWNRLREDAGARYGAAARLVQEIEERAGREGLQRLVKDVGEGRVTFEDALARAMGG